jgi:hypothetical protein
VVVAAAVEVGTGILGIPPIRHLLNGVVTAASYGGLELG